VRKPGTPWPRSSSQWRDDLTVKVRGSFRGFEILSRGSDQKDREPDLFVRGREAYKANLNLENPLDCYRQESCAG
jgi:hypothetical protein